VSELQVLVVDDEQAIRQILKAKLQKAGHVVDSVGDAETALEKLSQGDYDVCLCDIRLPGMDGVALLHQARAAGLSTNFLMMTAFASVEAAVEAMRGGAFDYLTKPLRFEDVLHRLARIQQLIGLRDENRRLREQVEKGDKEYFRSTSEPMSTIERVVEKVASSSGTVLITGESGTGKSMIARRIHERSSRADRPFLSVNCGAIPENLLESELFGHVKGAFTGADRAKRGIFREADGGTLLLDEICELPLLLQVKLLHALEEGEVRPVGSERGVPVAVRIVAASNRDLPGMVSSGRFRMDLYYRLNVLQIVMPSLRERQSDLPALIRFFLSRESRRLGLKQPRGIDPMAEEILLGYSWPGNLREMQNVIARVLVMTEGEIVTVADLPRLEAPAEAAHSRQTRGIGGEGSLRERVARFEMENIREALQRAEGDRREAARQLGIGLSTLYRKIEEYRMTDEEVRGSEEASS